MYCLLVSLITSFYVSFQPQANSGTQLSGYGVQLVVKSTEYKAVDDTAIKGQAMHVDWH